MKSLVDIKSLTLRYRGQSVPALENINFNIERGEHVLVLGPSGCGKSTLLQIISGVIPELIPPDVLDGKIKLNYSHLGILLQNPKSQMISTTVEGELAFCLENQGIPPHIIREKINNAITRFGLEHLRFRKSNSLSGGETQKVALISAILSEPELLLLDEPTSYLDFTATAELLDIIEELPKETAIIIVEHRWDIFIRYTERVIIFNDRGKIIFDGSRQQFLSNKKYYLKIVGIWDMEGLLQNYTKDINALSPVFSTTKPILKTAKLLFSYNNTKNTNNQDKAENFSLSYINLSFKRGETTVILGENGAGKTTLLENIAAFFKETFKYIFLLDTPYESLSTEDIYSNINYVPQNPEYLFLKEKVIDELNYNKITSKESNTAIFDWSDKLYTNPFSLSEGEKRRLSLTILFNDLRNITLMDEPTYGLDFKAYVTLIETVKKLKTQSNNTLIIVTHDINFASIIADRVVLMERGKILFDGIKSNFLKSKLYSMLIDKRNCTIKNIPG